MNSCQGNGGTFSSASLSLPLWSSGSGCSAGGAENFKAKYEGADLSTDVTGIGRSNTYGAYVAQYADLPAVTETVEVDLASFEGKGGEVCADGVMTADESELTWKVTMPKAGLYNIQLDYLTVESRGIDIEREIAINGEVPFSGASTLSFSRLWTDAGEVRKDNQGNDVRPTQVERYEKQTAYCKDDMGYQTEPYAFYFNEGENELTIRAVNEPVILCGITLTPIVKFPTYEEYLRRPAGGHHERRRPRTTARPFRVKPRNCAAHRACMPGMTAVPPRQ